MNKVDRPKLRGIPRITVAASLPSSPLRMDTLHAARALVYLASGYVSACVPSAERSRSAKCESEACHK